MWLPLWSTISIGPLSSSAWATTWLLVITWPLLSMTKPDPVAPCSSPSYSATICTELGSTFSATAAMLALSAGSGGAVRRSTLKTSPGTPPSPATSAPESAPPVRPRIRAISATAGHIQPGTFARAAGSVTG